MNRLHEHYHDHDRNDYRYRVGERIRWDDVIIREPRRYDLDPDYSYAHVGDTFYRVDRDTRVVLDVIGALTRLSN